MTITEAMGKLKGQDRASIRIIPEDIRSPFGKQLIQLLERGSWNTVISMDDRKTAEGVVSQVSNRTMFG